jgi:hypothetical protein
LNSLVVIDNFNAFGAICSARPFEADSPLLIAPDTVLAVSATGQCFQAIAAQLSEIAQTRRRFKDPQPLLGLMAE